MKLAAATLFAGLLAAQTVDPGLPPAGEPGAIDGRVVNAVTGEPLKKAAVVLFSLSPSRSGRPVQPRTVLSDAEGRFVFHGVAGGDYRVTASRPGFIDPQMGTYAPIVNLNPLQGFRSVVVKLEPLAVVAGKIVDEDGDPIRNATVQLARYRYFEGRRRLSPAGGSANTNDRGEYRIFDIMPGRYYLVAHHHQVALWGGSSQGFGTSYYPGARQASQASTIEVAAGQELRSVDFRLPLEPLYKLAVRTTPAGPRVNAAAIEIHPLDGEPMFRGFASSVSRRPDGTMEYDRLHAGRYRVTARLQDETAAMLMGVQVVELPGAAEVLLTLRPPSTVKGSVTMPAGARAPIHVFLRSLHGPDGQSPNATVQPDSTFQIGGVPPGEYAVRMMTPPNLYLKAVRQNGENRPGFRIDLSSGDGGALELILANDTGSVTGSIALPSSGLLRPYAVVLAPFSADGGAKGLETRADPEGAFTFPPAPPGEYLVAALEEINSGAAEDPDFAKDNEKRGVRVTVRPSARVLVEQRVPLISDRP